MTMRDNLARTYVTRHTPCSLGQVIAKRAARIDPKPIHRQRPLSPTEHKACELAAEGLSNKQIAARLNTTHNVIRNYMARIYEKTGMGSRLELALMVLGQRNEAI